MIKAIATATAVAALSVTAPAAHAVDCPKFHGVPTCSAPPAKVQTRTTLLGVHQERTRGFVLAPLTYTWVHGRWSAWHSVYVLPPILGG